MPFLATTTISVEGGSQGLWRRKNSRSLLFKEFRLTAFPTFLLTTIPRRGLPFRLERRNTKKYRVLYRLPLRVVARNSRRMRSRSCLEKDRSGRWHPCVFKGWRIGSYEPFRGRHPVGGLNGESLAALRPPTAQDLSSTSYPHTSPKSVRSFSSNRAGLIGAFHGSCLSLSEGTRPASSNGFTVPGACPPEGIPKHSQESPPGDAGRIPKGSRLHCFCESIIGEHKSPVLSTSSAVSAFPVGSRPISAVPVTTRPVSPPVPIDCVSQDSA